METVLIHLERYTTAMPHGHGSAQVHGEQQAINGAMNIALKRSVFLKALQLSVR
jgi:hypothetical protein